MTTNHTRACQDLLAFSPENWDCICDTIPLPLSIVERVTDAMQKAIEVELAGQFDPNGVLDFSSAKVGRIGPSTVLVRIDGMGDRKIAVKVVVLEYQ